MNLLDTDIFSLSLNGHPKVLTRITAESDFAITIVTRIEILQGRFDAILKADRGERLLLAQDRLDRAFRDVLKQTTMTFTSESADVFNRLRLDRRLKKIGRADLLIANIALANRATLVTRNVRHFQLVPGLKIENWAD